MQAWEQARLDEIGQYSEIYVVALPNRNQYSLAYRRNIQELILRDVEC